MRRRKTFDRPAGSRCGLGDYGFYEALDYTPTRVAEGEEVAIVRAYMAHHQGMTLVAIDDALRDGVMRSRFHAEPIIQRDGASCSRKEFHATFWSPVPAQRK